MASTMLQLTTDLNKLRDSGLNPQTANGNLCLVFGFCMAHICSNSQLGESQLNASRQIHFDIARWLLPSCSSTAQRLRRLTAAWLCQVKAHMDVYFSTGSPGIVPCVFLSARMTSWDPVRLVSTT